MLDYSVGELRNNAGALFKYNKTLAKKVNSHMLNTLIVGASSYAGSELTAYLNRHPCMNITALAISAQSADA